MSFASSVDVNVYEHQLLDNWTVQIGKAKPSESSYQFDESVLDPRFFGFWIWPSTMFNMPPGGDFMTVIYEFPVNAGETLQHYDIYFLNEELTEYQKNLVEWYRTVFRPEDLRLVESVQKDYAHGVIVAKAALWQIGNVAGSASTALPISIKSSLVRTLSNHVIYYKNKRRSHKCII